MRLVENIPHDRFKIQLFSYNNKYHLKVELSQFEQWFKIGELDVMGANDVKDMITPQLLERCMGRFIEMRKDWEEAFRLKNTEK